MDSGIVSEPLKIKNLFLNLSEINPDRCSKIKDILEKFYTVYFRVDASSTSIQNLTEHRQPSTPNRKRNFHYLFRKAWLC